MKLYKNGFMILLIKDLKIHYKKILVAVVLIIVVITMEGPSGGAIEKRVSRFYRATFETTRQTGDAAVTALPASVIDIIAPGPAQKDIKIYRTPFDTFASNRGYLWRRSLEIMTASYPMPLFSGSFSV